MKRENEYNKNNRYILVDSKKRCISLYEDEVLIRKFHEVYFGRNGLTITKSEGDFCTPIGEFNLGFAFGTEDFDTNYPYYKINNNIYWVSDSDSSYYNEWVELSETKKKYPFQYMKSVKQKSWNEAEHLIDYAKQYKLGIVIEYNLLPRIKNAGSAIFLHVKSNHDYTAGCIATNEETLKYIIKWLENGKAVIKIQ